MMIFCKKNITKLKLMYIEGGIDGLVPQGIAELNPLNTFANPSSQGAASLYSPINF
ncbi:hypothetical protein TUMEXPCC7403_16385 [Tumidithrix helvetica PCC 7403]